LEVTQRGVNLKGKNKQEGNVGVKIETREREI
jgi:hypothetical protein